MQNRKGIAKYSRPHHSQIPTLHSTPKTLAYATTMMQAAVTAPVAPGATDDNKACLAKLRSFCCSRVELAAARCTEVYTASTLQADSDVWNFHVSRAHIPITLGEKARVELRTQIQAIHYIQVCRSPLFPPAGPFSLAVGTLLQQPRIPTWTIHPNRLRRESSAPVSSAAMPERTNSMPERHRCRSGGLTGRCRRNLILLLRTQSPPTRRTHDALNGPSYGR